MSMIKRKSALLTKKSAAPRVKRERHDHDNPRWRREAMTNPIIMNDDDRVKFERGCEILSHLQAGKGFDDTWVPIGEGLLAIRRSVMTALRLTKAKGVYYNAAFGQTCARTPYAEMHKVTRSNLLYCMEHLPTILEMRVGWTPTERAKINHPDTMAKRLREFINRAPTDAPTRRNVSPMALLKDRNGRLHPRQPRSGRNDCLPGARKR